MDKTKLTLLLTLIILILIILGYATYQEGIKAGRVKFYQEVGRSFVDDGDWDFYFPYNETTSIHYNLVDINSCCDRCELSKLLQGGGG